MKEFRFGRVVLVVALALAGTAFAAGCRSASSTSATTSSQPPRTTTTVPLTTSPPATTTTPPPTTTSPRTTTTPPPTTTAVPPTTTSPTTQPTSTTPAGQSVSISGFAFSPATLTVSVGTTVTWTNNDSTTHTVTSDSGAFSSGNLANGKIYSYTFTTAGTYAYHCAIHTYMKATIIVQ